MSKVFLTDNDKVLPRVEYIGIWHLLDILMKKIEKEDDIDKIKIYCQLYKMIYELKGSDKE